MAEGYSRKERVKAQLSRAGRVALPALVVLGTAAYAGRHHIGEVVDAATANRPASSAPGALPSAEQLSGEVVAFRVGDKVLVCRGAAVAIPVMGTRSALVLDPAVRPDGLPYSPYDGRGVMPPLGRNGNTWFSLSTGQRLNGPPPCTEETYTGPAADEPNWPATQHGPFGLKIVVEDRQLGQTVQQLATTTAQS